MQYTCTHVGTPATFLVSFLARLSQKWRASVGSQIWRPTLIFGGAVDFWLGHFLSYLRLGQLLPRGGNQHAAAPLRPAFPYRSGCFVGQGQIVRRPPAELAARAPVLPARAAHARIFRCGIRQIACSRDSSSSSQLAAEL